VWTEDEGEKKNGRERGRYDVFWPNREEFLFVGVK